MRFLRNVVAMGAVLSVMGISCSRGDDAYTYSTPAEIIVAFDRTLAPDADPEGMSTIFFPLTEMSRIWQFEIAGRDGGRVVIDCGRYAMLAVNNDLPGVVRREEGSYSTFSMAVREAEAGAPAAPPGMLYGGRVDELNVTPCGVSYSMAGGWNKSCRKGLMRCCIDSLSTCYTLLCGGVEGIERVRSARAVLEGTAESVRVCDGEPGERSLPVACPLMVEREGEVMRGEMCAFPFVREGNTPAALILEVVMNDGKNYSKRMELRAENVNRVAPHHVIITVGKVALPDEPGSDVGGMDVDVDGWNTIEIFLESQAL